MKRTLWSIACIALLSATTLSCKRQTIYKPISEDENSTIQFTIDWSESNIDQADIYNVSLYAYPDDGGSPYLRVSGDIESAYISLPVGFYSLLIFNDVVENITGVNFVDVESYSEVSAEVTNRSSISDLYYDIDDHESIANKHGQLAAWRAENFEVTKEMVECGYCEDTHDSDDDVNIEVAPTPLTTQCIVTIRFENLYNANIIQGVLRGFTKGVYLASEQRVASPEDANLYSIEFTSRTYDDTNYIDGVTKAEITTFGKSPNEDQSYELVIDVILNSGELVTFYRDVTDQVSAQNNTEIIINLTTNDDIISLPEGSGTGFGVVGWGERESIELM